MNLLLIFLSVIAVFLGLYFYFMDRKTRKLRKNLKVGDKCTFFHQWKKRLPEERTNCTITKIEGKKITIEFFGDEFITTRKNLYL